MCCPLVFEFSVGIGGFVIGLGQISIFFSPKWVGLSYGMSLTLMWSLVMWSILVDYIVKMDDSLNKQYYKQSFRMQVVTFLVANLNTITCQCMHTRNWKKIKARTILTVYLLFSTFRSNKYCEWIVNKYVIFCDDDSMMLGNESTRNKINKIKQYYIVVLILHSCLLSMWYVLFITKWDIRKGKTSSNST